MTTPSAYATKTFQDFSIYNVYQTMDQTESYYGAKVALEYIKKNCDTLYPRSSSSGYNYGWNSIRENYNIYVDVGNIYPEVHPAKWAKDLYNNYIPNHVKFFPMCWNNSSSCVNCRIWEDYDVEINTLDNWYPYLNIHPRLLVYDIPLYAPSSIDWDDMETNRFRLQKCISLTNNLFPNWWRWQTSVTAYMDFPAVMELYGLLKVGLRKYAEEGMEFLMCNSLINGSSTPNHANLLISNVGIAKMIETALNGTLTL